MGKYCVIGKKLAHTFSPEMHGYFGLDYSKEELSDTLAVADFFHKSAYDGCNVTVPYKQTVIPYLDELSPLAQELGAVNTVVKRDGKLWGYNTDVDGILSTLSKLGISIQNKVVAVLGSGGAAVAVKFALRVRNAGEIITVSRSGPIDYNNIYLRKDIEIVINTTPLGMYPDIDASPLDLSRFPRLVGVMDLIYNPLKTKLLLQAEKLGLTNLNGLYMLVEQARKSRDIFLSDKSDTTLTEKVYDILHKNKTNLVLIGMPGVGKSTIGKALAVSLKRDYIDTDEEIVRTSLMTIPEIFKSVGETGFRKLEKEQITKASARISSVISTGGGVPLDFDNVDKLRHNGIIIWLKRDVGALATEGRPLSTDSNMKELYKTRYPYYQKAADVEHECCDDIKKNTEEIIRLYEKYFGN